MNLDKRLDEILDPPAYGFSAEFLCYECMFDFKEAKQAIKQLMAEEFEKLIGEDEPELVMVKNASGGETPISHANRRYENKLRAKQRQKLEEWKQ